MTNRRSNIGPARFQNQFRPRLFVRFWITRIIILFVRFALREYSSRFFNTFESETTPLKNRTISPTLNSNVRFGMTDRWRHTFYPTRRSKKRKKDRNEMIKQLIKLDRKRKNSLDFTNCHIVRLDFYRKCVVR